MINLRAVALLGIGLVGLAGASLGLAPEEAVQPIVQQAAPQAAGGLSGDAGSGYIWRDNAWVKATKYAKVGVSIQGVGVPTSRVSVSAVGKRWITNTPTGKVSSITAASLELTRSTVSAEKGSTFSDSYALCTCDKVIVSSYNGTCESLGMDEIMVLVGMAT